MGKLEKFDKKSAREVGQRAAELLKALGEEIGAKVIYAGGSLDEGEFKAKFSFKLKQVGGVDNAEAEFKRYCAQFGLKPEHFGASLETPRGPAKIVGLNLRGRKRPIVLELNGKRYIFEDRFVRKQLGCPYDWEKSERATPLSDPRA